MIQISITKGGFIMRGKNTLRHMLIIASGFAFLVIPLLFWLLFVVKHDLTGIAADNEIAGSEIYFFIYIQVFIFSALIRTSRGLLVAAAIVSIISALLYLYLGFIFIVTDAFPIGILFFFTAGFNLITGLLALSLRHLLLHNQPDKLI